MRRLPWAAPLAFCVAVLANLSVRQAFWNLDDWGLLARAAGMLPDAGFPPRALSQVLYWKLLYPLLGLDPVGYGWSRLLLHGANAALVTLIAARCRVAFAGQLFAGLLFAICPQAFEALFWASGVQELLGAFGALMAIERLLAGGRRNRWIAVGFGILSILSKENGLGLPLFWAALALWGARTQERRRGREEWLQIAIVMGVALVECVLLVAAFRPGARRPYAMQVGSGALANLGLCATWMLTVGLRMVRDAPMGARIAGLAFWLLWAESARRRWLANDRRPAALLAACLLSLAPVLLLKSHLYVYYAYLAMGALAIALAVVVPPRLTESRLAVLAMLVFALLWGRSTFEFRLQANARDGLPTENLVRRSQLSQRAAAVLRSGAPHIRGPIVLFAPGSRLGDTRNAAPSSGAESENLMQADALYGALGGDIGPRLLLGNGTDISWMSDFSRAPATSFVLASIGGELQPWGPLPRALRLLALSEVGAGSTKRARADLVQAMAMDADLGFTCPQAFLPCPLPDVRVAASALAAEWGDGPESIELRRLLAKCTN